MVWISASSSRAFPLPLRRGCRADEVHEAGEGSQSYYEPLIRPPSLSLGGHLLPQGEKERAHIALSKRSPDSALWAGRTRIDPGLNERS